MTGNKRVQVFYSGQVQGVGFRYNAKQVAQKFPVTGFVKNKADGRVELVAEGSEDQIKTFLRAIGQSEMGPNIRHEDIFWGMATGEFRDFSIAT